MYSQCCLSSIKTLESRITRVLDVEKKLKRKKKHPSYKSLIDFLNASFLSPVNENLNAHIQLENSNNPLAENKSPNASKLSNDFSSQIMSPNADNQILLENANDPPSKINNQSAPNQTLIENASIDPLSEIKYPNASSQTLIENDNDDPHTQHQTTNAQSQTLIENANDDALPQHKNANDPLYETKSTSARSRPLIENANDEALPQHKNANDPLYETKSTSAPSQTLIENANDEALPQHKNPSAPSQTLFENANEPPFKDDKSCQISSPSQKNMTECPSLKDVNQLRNEIAKQQRKLLAIQKLVETENTKFDNLKKVNGHFSVRNVTKRDDNAREARKTLNSVKSTLVRKENLLKVLQLSNDELRSKLTESESKQIDLDKTVLRLKDIEHKKTKAQKLASHYRTSSKKNQCDQLDGFKYEMKKMQDEIDFLTDENVTLKEKLRESKCVTKNRDGSFSNCIRLCVIELFGLEIGMEKITSAIEIVCKHLFGYSFEQSELPTTTTVRHIVDEGHYLAKSFIAHKIEKSESIGLSRDGTTRRKEKILDTSVTLDSGEIMSLGFTKVSRETSEKINNVTKMHMQELAETVESNDFIEKSLEKLSFTMSDRASNEKCADKLLNNWRDSVLKDCTNEEEKQTVFQFHCMCHVLLGFHRNVHLDFKNLEKEIVTTHGPVGRDSLDLFKNWKDTKSVAERMTYTCSGIFGPAGDHLGTRDRWEAYCARHGIKSRIGNYKDNRFNSLFQTAAEVFLHREDFLHVLDSFKTTNRKVKSVEGDLQSDIACLFLRALTVIYIKVTGPYWSLVTSSSIGYLHLFPHIQNLHSYLIAGAENPDTLNEASWFEEDLFVPHIEHYENKLLNPVPEEIENLLKTMLSQLCKSLIKTIEKQLVDFLPNGRYSTIPTEKDSNRTKCSQLNNLACEHHFGDLDSSQKRRPNASFHHHSSVQLLKRNRQKLMNWVSGMPENAKSLLLKKARRGGQLLRKRHRENEFNVQSEVYENMEKERNSKRRKTVKDSECRPDDEFEQDTIDFKELLPDMDKGFVVNEYVVVAYQDSWYPGCVQKLVNEKRACVNFMSRCKKKGTFMWPSRADQQMVDAEFVLMRGLIPECFNSGRQWFFNEHIEIDKLYDMYKDNFF